MNELVYCIIRRKKNIYASLFYGIQIIKEIETLRNHPNLKTNKWDNALVWPPCYTAVDFRASLRFPQAAAKPPRRLRSNQQLETTTYMKLPSP
jgi:hypothetical protein